MSKKSQPEGPKYPSEVMVDPESAKLLKIARQEGIKFVIFMQRGSMLSVVALTNVEEFARDVAVLCQKEMIRQGEDTLQFNAVPLDAFAPEPHRTVSVGRASGRAQ